MTGLITPPIYITGDGSPPLLDDNDISQLHSSEKSTPAVAGSFLITVTPPPSPPLPSDPTDIGQDEDIERGRQRLCVSETAIRAPSPRRPGLNGNSILTRYHEGTSADCGTTKSPSPQPTSTDKAGSNDPVKDDLLDVGHRIRTKTHDPSWRLSLASISEDQQVSEENQKQRAQEPKPRSRQTSYYETCVVPGCLVNYAARESAGVHYATHLNPHITDNPSRKKVGYTLLQKYLHQALSPKVAKRLLLRAAEISLEATLRTMYQSRSTEKRSSVDISSLQNSSCVYACVAPSCAAQLWDLPSLYRHYLAHICSEGSAHVPRVDFDSLLVYLSEMRPEPEAETRKSPIRKMARAASESSDGWLSSAGGGSRSQSSTVQTHRVCFSLEVTMDEKTISRKPVPLSEPKRSQVDLDNSSVLSSAKRPLSTTSQGDSASSLTPDGFQPAVARRPASLQVCDRCKMTSLSSQFGSRAPTPTAMDAVSGSRPSSSTRIKHPDLRPRSALESYDGSRPSTSTRTRYPDLRPRSALGSYDEDEGTLFHGLKASWRRSRELSRSDETERKEGTKRTKIAQSFRRFLDWVGSPRR